MSLSSRIGRWLSQKPEVRYPRLFALIWFLLSCGTVVLQYLYYLEKVARKEAFEARLGIAQDTQGDFYFLLVFLVMGLAYMTIAAVYAVPDRWSRIILGLKVTVILLFLLMLAGFPIAITAALSS